MFPLPMLNFPALLRYWYHIRVKYALKPPKRYREILSIIRRTRPVTIVEIGVYQGSRAIEMINAASIMRPAADIRYVGFDLFEMLTEELCTKEYSKLPPNQAAVEAFLQTSGAQIRLIKGYSQETVPAFAATASEPADIIFIDGGHAVETIRADFENVLKIMGPKTTVVFDDYYTNTEAEVPGVGCQSIIAGLDPTVFDSRIGEIEDTFEKPWGTLRIRLAFVRKR